MNYPQKLTEFIKTADSKKLGLFTKTIQNPEKFCKTVAQFQELINEFNTIQWLYDLPLAVKIQWIKQDIVIQPTCPNCGKELTWVPSLTKYNTYCSRKCGHVLASKESKKTSNIEEIRRLYHQEKLSILEISKILGNISNVTLKKLMVENGIELRSHSENQKLQHPKNK